MAPRSLIFYCISNMYLFSTEKLSFKQIDQAQLEKVMKYIALGMEEGARLVTGGSRYGSKGMFVIPTIFADVKVSSRLRIPALVINSFK